MSKFSKKNDISKGMPAPDVRKGLGINADPSGKGPSFGVAGGLTKGSGEQISNMYGRPVAGYGEMPDKSIQPDEDYEDEEIRNDIDSLTGKGYSKTDSMSKNHYIGGRFGGLGQRINAGYERKSEVILENLIRLIIESSISGSSYTKKSIGNQYKNIGKGQSKNSNKKPHEEYTSSGPYKSRSLQGSGKITRHDDIVIKRTVPVRTSDGIQGSNTDFYEIDSDDTISVKKDNLPIKGIKDISYNTEDYLDVDSRWINIKNQHVKIK